MNLNDIALQWYLSPNLCFSSSDVRESNERAEMRVQCSTCLELLTPSDDLTCTPCGHVFHMACVVQWFENKKNCPQVTNIIIILIIKL